MRNLVASILVALVLLPATARANDAISQVIRDQIAAFQADDFATAFTYASPTIKQLFGTADRFGQMVQQGYPMVYRPADVTMLDQRVQGDTTIQRVRIRDASGQTHVLDYQMTPSDGGWQINGVQFVRQLDAGV
jgi:ketosteroid isomerase-like protein